MGRIIEKKILAEYFDKIRSGQKTFELRLADWSCRPGDTLILNEIDGHTKKPTGRTLKRSVGWVGKTKDTALNFWPKAEVKKYGYQVISLTSESQVGVSEKAVIQNAEGKVLVLLRGSTAPVNPLAWDLPGGDVEFGEDPEASIIREVKEETGLDVKELIPFDVDARVNPQGEHWFTIAYHATTHNDKVSISWEHDEYRWVSKAEFASLPSIPKIKRFISKLKEPE